MKDAQFALEPKHFKDRELLEATIAQIEKDFLGLELRLREVEAGPDYFRDLCVDLSHTLDALMDQHPERLFALAYRIDIPEERFRKVLALETPFLMLSELIMKRELQKVVLRKLYS